MSEPPTFMMGSYEARIPSDRWYSDNHLWLQTAAGGVRGERPFAHIKHHFGIRSFLLRRQPFTLGHKVTLSESVSGHRHTGEKGTLIFTHQH